jgi:hypothetical protein
MLPNIGVFFLIFYQANISVRQGQVKEGAAGKRAVPVSIFMPGERPGLGGRSFQNTAGLPAPILELSLLWPLPLIKLRCLFVP